MSQTSVIGKLMVLLAAMVMARLQSGETNWVSVEYHHSSDEWDEGIEWFYLSLDDEGEILTVTEANGIFQHSIEMVGTFMTDHEKSIFQEFEPQFAVLRQLLKAEAQLIKFAEDIVQSAKLH